MRDYVNIGSSPCDAPCVQVGQPDYMALSRKECARYIEEIRKVCGEEPFGAELRIKTFPHDFGSYCEVVCYFDEDQEDSCDYAYFVEGNGPEKWGEKKLSRKWVPALRIAEELDVLAEYYGVSKDDKDFLNAELMELNYLRHPTTFKTIYKPVFRTKDEMKNWLKMIEDLFTKKEEIE